METAAEIKVLARGEPVPLDLLIRSNLVQQELIRLGINIIALLNRTVNVAPDVKGKLRDLLDREVDRHDHEWIEAMQRLIITERIEKKPMTIRSRDVERDCRSIVNQLVNLMPKNVLLKTSFTKHRTSTHVQTTEEVRVESKSSFTRKVHFTDAREEYEPSSDCSSGDETLSGESGSFGTGQDDLSGETMLGQPRDRILSRETDSKQPRDRMLSGEPDSKRPRDRILSGESRNITDRLEHNDVESMGSSDHSRSQSWENTSETTSNSDVSEIAIHSLLVEWKQRGFDREIHQDPDRGRYTSDEEGTVVDNAADELELIAVSKRPTRLLPHGTVVRTNLEPSVQEATPLKNIWCVKLMDNAHAPEIISGQLNVVKTYLKARYRLSDLIRQGESPNGAPDKGNLEEESYKILKQFYLKRKDLLYLNKGTKTGSWPASVRRRKRFFTSIVRYYYRNCTRLNCFFRSHGQMGHQGVDKV